MARGAEAVHFHAPNVEYLAATESVAAAAFAAVTDDRTVQRRHRSSQVWRSAPVEAAVWRLVALVPASVQCDAVLETSLSDRRVETGSGKGLVGLVAVGMAVVLD